ncbi:unnamed protein product, partial [Brassica rapa]
MCTDGQPRTSVCADGHRRTHTDTHGQPTYVLPQGIKSPDQSTGRVSVLNPRTNVLICVLMDSHGRPVCADGHTQTHTDSHGCPVCADGHTRTSSTDVLCCVLNRQPTWAKITRTIHGKGQRAESKDQCADMCTDGQAQTSCVCRQIHTDRNTHGHTRTATNVLCVLVDTHGRPECTDQTAHMGQNHPNSPTHGRPVCASGHPRTSYSPQGTKSPEQSTGRVSVLNPRTNGLIYVLMDSHGRPMCADGHTQAHTDSHRCPVCADGHTRTSCPTWAKITQTVHGKGKCAESKDQRAHIHTDVLCVLTNTHGHTHGHTRTATDVLCVLTDSHVGQNHPNNTYVLCVLTVTDGHTWTATDVLCVLADTHGRPVCTDQIAHVGQNHPNSPREGSAC